MIAEPYICIRGPIAGQIHWVKPGTEFTDPQEEWKPYADFERKKLRELGRKDKTSYLYSAGEPCNELYGWHWTNGYGDSHCSTELTGYTAENYWNDTESSRLLKRAEFLKAICEKEGVEWLPASCGCRNAAEMCMNCPPSRCNGSVQVGPENPAAVAFDRMIREHANKLGLPPEKLGVPEGDFERNYYTKAEIDDMLKSYVRIAPSARGSWEGELNLCRNNSANGMPTAPSGGAGPGIS